MCHKNDKYSKFVVTVCFFQYQKTPKTFSAGVSPRTLLRELTIDAPPDSLAGLEGGHVPSIPFPLAVFGASILPRYSVLAIRPRELARIGGALALRCAIIM